MSRYYRIITITKQLLGRRHTDKLNCHRYSMDLTEGMKALSKRYLKGGSRVRYYCVPCAEAVKII